jgi:hypothetical protein
VISILVLLLPSRVYHDLFDLSEELRIVFQEESLLLGLLIHMDVLEISLC